MTDIFKIVDGEKVLLTEMDPSKRYSLTTEGLRELSEDAETARIEEDAAFIAKLEEKRNAPPELTVEEKILALETRITELEGLLNP